MELDYRGPIRWADYSSPVAGGWVVQVPEKDSPTHGGTEWDQGGAVGGEVGRYGGGEEEEDEGLQHFCAFFVELERETEQRDKKHNNVGCWGNGVYCYWMGNGIDMVETGLRYYYEDCFLSSNYLPFLERE